MTNGKIKVWMVGGALRYGGRLLLCRRRPDRGSYPDMWDLPGGHVEPGEDDTAALARESREELGVDVVTSVGVALAELSPGAVLSVRLIVHWRGEPYNAAPKEHREIGFFTTEEMAELRLADARYLPLLTDLLRPSPSVEIRRLDDEAWDSVGALHAPVQAGDVLTTAALPSPSSLPSGRPDRALANSGLEWLHRAALARVCGQGGQDLHLWVLAGNVRARRFYEKHGWRQAGGHRMITLGGGTLPAVDYARSL